MQIEVAIPPRKKAVDEPDTGKRHQKSQRASHKRKKQAFSQ
jgi:hypothetical protein